MRSSWRSRYRLLCPLYRWIEIILPTTSTANTVCRAKYKVYPRRPSVAADGIAAEEFQYENRLVFTCLLGSMPLRIRSHGFKQLLKGELKTVIWWLLICHEDGSWLHEEIRIDEKGLRGQSRVARARASRFVIRTRSTRRVSVFHSEVIALGNPGKRNGNRNLTYQSVRRV